MGWRTYRSHLHLNEAVIMQRYFNSPTLIEMQNFINNFASNLDDYFILLKASKFKHRKK